MSGRGRSPKKSRRETVHHVHTPECGKRGYLSRADAKRVLRRHRKGPKPNHMVRPYQCPNCGYFHLGAPPIEVKRGLMTAAEFFGR